MYVKNKGMNIMVTKVTTVRIPTEVQELANTLILYRAYRKKVKAESFSSLIKNLIIEGWEREKKIIAQSKEERLK